MFVDPDFNVDMASIVEDQSKHLLSLDALDLSLLPAICQPWLEEDISYLWKKKPTFPHGKEYFEFVIKPKFESDDDLTTEQTTHTTCYICNTAVPIAYVNDHVNSLKHVAYQKIAEIGIERAGKYKQLSGVERMKSDLEYFCEHCVSIIDISNKNEHEKSKTHKNFAALDKFVNNFALFYVNNEAAYIVSSEKPKSVQDDPYNDISLLKVDKKASDNDLECNVDFEVMPLKVNDNIHTDIDLDKDSALQNKLKSSMDLITAIESQIDEGKEMNNNDTNDCKYEKAYITNNLDQYIQRLKLYGTAKLYTYDSSNQDRIKIETSNGFELVVSIFNFHGIKKVGKHLQCRLCECVIKNVNSHRERERHMKYIAQPFVDKHCIRRLRDNLNHCVICNEVMDNAVVHAQFNKHAKKLEQALVSKGNENSNTVNNDADVAMNSIKIELDTPEPSKTDVNKNEETTENVNLAVNNIETNASRAKAASDCQYYCLPCDTEMHINNVETHLVGTKHIANSKSVIYYLMNKDKNNVLTCKVCNKIVNYYTWAVEDHIASANHVENYNNCLAANMIDEREDNFFCNPCGKVLARTSEFSHIEKQSHKVKLASRKLNCIKKNVKRIENVHVNNNSTEEKVLEKDIEGKESDVLDTNAANTQNIEDNESNIQNSTNVSVNVEKLPCEEVENNDTTSQANTLYECAACNEEIPNISSNIVVHNESAKHKTMDVLLTGVNKLLEELLQYFNHSPEIHSHLQLTDTENVLNCVVCKYRVSIEDSEKHTNSLKHIHNHRALMIANKIKLRKDNYVCYACSVYVETGKEIQHIETVEHEKRIESLKNGDFVLLTAENKKMIDKIHNDIKISELNNEETLPKHTTLGDFIPNNKEYTVNDDSDVTHHFCHIIDNKKRLVCLLCQVLVEKAEVMYRTHVNDVTHEANYEAVMSYNKMFQIEEGFVCLYCECLINGNEFEHVCSEKHCLNQSSDPKKNFCFACKVSMIDSGIKKHVTSEDHVKNIGAPSHYYCNVCNITFKNNYMNIRRHNESFEHRSAYQLVEENKITLKNKKCLCQICETTFGREGLEDHVASLNHVMLLHHDIYQPTADQCWT